MIIYPIYAIQHHSIAALCTTESLLTVLAIFYCGYHFEQSSRTFLALLWQHSCRIPLAVGVTGYLIFYFRTASVRRSWDNNLQNLLLWFFSPPYKLGNLHPDGCIQMGFPLSWLLALLLIFFMGWLTILFEHIDLVIHLVISPRRYLWNTWWS